MKTTLLLIATAALLAGCRNEPDPWDVAWETRMAADSSPVGPNSRLQVTQPIVANGGALPMHVTQDSTVAHYNSVRSVMTPPGVKRYTLGRRIDPSNPRIMNRASVLEVKEEDEFWRADGDDAPIIEGMVMPDTTIGNLARSPSAIKLEQANQIGELIRNSETLVDQSKRVTERLSETWTKMAESEKRAAALAALAEQQTAKAAVTEQRIEELLKRMDDGLQKIDDFNKTQARKSKNASFNIEADPAAAKKK